MIGLNNPFNIRYSNIHWQGLNDNNPSTRGFCNFISLHYGIRCAWFLLIRSYRKKGLLTIEQIINRFAPSSENDTQNYIKFVEKKTFISRSRPLSNIYEYSTVLFAMSIFEGNRVELSEILYVYFNTNKIESLKMYDYGKT